MVVMRVGEEWEKSGRRVGEGWWDFGGAKLQVGDHIAKTRATYCK
jgi:hypothetical protein